MLFVSTHCAVIIMDEASRHSCHWIQMSSFQQSFEIQSKLKTLINISKDIAHPFIDGHNYFLSEWTTSASAETGNWIPDLEWRPLGPLTPESQGAGRSWHGCTGTMMKTSLEQDVRRSGCGREQWFLEGGNLYTWWSSQRGHSWDLSEVKLVIVPFSSEKVFDWGLAGPADNGRADETVVSTGVHKNLRGKGCCGHQRGLSR